MDWSDLQGQWKQVSPRVRQRWGKLLDTDLEPAGDQRAHLLERIRLRYGVVHDEAERQIRNWERKTGLFVAADHCAETSGAVSSSAVSRCRNLHEELMAAHAEVGRLRTLLESAREGERLARHLAQHDGLTTLPNRQAFVEGLNLALQQCTTQADDLAVMFIDIDQFKLINDCHGHQVGDQLLAIIGNRLTQSVRAADLVARLGGDEFACLLRHAPSLAGTALVAAKLCEDIAAPVQVGRVSLRVEASIGIATFSASDARADAEQLLGRADRAMYHAKRQQSHFCFAADVEGAAG